MSKKGIDVSKWQGDIDWQKVKESGVEFAIIREGYGKEDRIAELIPTAKASFQVLEGTKIRKNEQLSKPLLATFELFEEYMKVWNPEREMEYGLFRVPIPEFSESAYRKELFYAILL